VASSTAGGAPRHFSLVGSHVPSTRLFLQLCDCRRAANRWRQA